MAFGYHMGPDIMFSIFPLVFGLVFFIVICVFIYIAVKGIMTYTKNNDSPILSVNCIIADKRTDISRHSSSGADNMSMSSHTSTTYYVTFQVESGDRLEFQINGREYGQLSQGDTGKLTFQGSRYLGFQREIVMQK